MKIAFLNIYQNKVARGAETFVYELSSRLSKNHEVDVISDVNYFNLLKNKYDVVIPINGRLQAIIVRIVTWLNGGKVIISGQSGIGFDDRLNLYTFPKAFIALTNYQKKWAEKINPFVKIIKIPNGVNLNIYKPSNQHKNVILSVGAFTKEKRHDLTIKAVAKLPNVRLVIVGSGGQEKENIKSIGEKMLQGRFEIKTISHDKMPDVYKEASLLAFPTVPWESFGIAMVEAMASNMPVVASDDPIRREIVNDAGLFVDPTNIDAYAATIQKALDTNWGNKPRNQAKKFDWDIIADQYEKLLKEII